MNYTVFKMIEGAIVSCSPKGIRSPLKGFGFADEQIGIPPTVKYLSIVDKNPVWNISKDFKLCL